MNRKTYEVLTVLCFLTASYAAICVNEFASVVAAFVCIVGVICCYKLFKLPEPYWDNPLWDSTDAAHPAFWRGEEHSCNQFCRLIKDVLSGKNKCKGRMYEPLETVRNSVFELKRKCERLKEQNKQQNKQQTITIGNYQTKLFQKLKDQKIKCFDDIQLCKNCKASVDCERLDYYGYRDYCKWED